MRDLINYIVLGWYPYFCLTVFLLGSLVRFDREQYTWRSGSSSEALYTTHMIASTSFCSIPRTQHSTPRSLYRMQPRCHLIVKRIPSTSPIYSCRKVCSLLPGVREHERPSFAHTSLCQSKPNRFADSLQGMPFLAASAVFQCTAVCIPTGLEQL